MARTKATTPKTNPRMNISGKKVFVPKKLTVDIPEEAKIKKPHRFRPGTVALRQIRKLQKDTSHQIARLSFQRVIRDIIVQVEEELSIPHNMRIQAAALESLQEITESMLTDLFSKSMDVTVHANRVTLMPKDMRLVKRILEPRDIVANDPLLSDPTERNVTKPTQANVSKAEDVDEDPEEDDEDAEDGEDDDEGDDE